MKLYVINLDRDTERLAAQSEQFSRYGIGFERVVALADAAWSRFRWWCAVLRPVVKGELGCAASHCECYSRLLAGGDACAAIFEDDVRFSPKIKPALEKAEAFCRRHPRAVILLGCHHAGKAGCIESGKSASGIEIVPESWDHCAEGYVIGREAAAKLLSKQSPVRVPIDWWGYFCKKGWIDLYRTEPPVCAQQVERFESNIGERYVANMGSFGERLWWKMRRLAGVALDTVMDGRIGW